MGGGSALVCLVYYCNFLSNFWFRFSISSLDGSWVLILSALINLVLSLEKLFYTAANSIERGVGFSGDCFTVDSRQASGSIV